MPPSKFEIFSSVVTKSCIYTDHTNLYNMIRYVYDLCLSVIHYLLFFWIVHCSCDCTQSMELKLSLYLCPKEKKLSILGAIFFSFWYFLMIENSSIIYPEVNQLWVKVGRKSLWSFIWVFRVSYAINGLWFSQITVLGET